MSKINWKDWTEEAFREASEQRKPILLDIMATWCHWCHVMDATSYDDERVVEIINKEFIPIRVDTDRRPDINARYNMGGWPTTAFLTSEGDVLTGGTYIPPERFAETLRTVSQAYRESGSALGQRAATIREDRQKSTSVGSSSSLSDRIVNDIIWAIRSDYDKANGGIGAQPKFPQPWAVELLLNHYHRIEETDLRDMGLGTLDAMMSGDLWDEIGGGFFRYATTHDWKTPHYEKLLSDQAGMVRNYIQGYQATTRKEYLQIAKLTLAYVESVLYDNDLHAFYGSQSADEEYYALSAKERLQRDAPPVDKTVYTDWNTDMAFAYLKAYEATLHEPYLKTAKQIADFLLKTMRTPAGGMCHYYDGAPRAYGMLSDQVSTAWLLCELHQCTGIGHYLDSAVELAGVMKTDFADSLGGFLDVTVDRAKDERLPFRDKPLDINGFAARTLIRLAALTGDNSHRLTGEAALRALAARYKRHGYMAALYGLAVADALQEPVEIALVGHASDERMDELRKSALKSYEPYKVVVTFDPEVDQQRLQDKGYPVPDKPKAFVCIAQTCQPPTAEPEAVEEAVAKAGGHTEEV